jgi:hypothetical protein
VFRVFCGPCGVSVAAEQCEAALGSSRISWLSFFSHTDVCQLQAHGLRESSFPEYFPCGYHQDMTNSESDCDRGRAGRPVKRLAAFEVPLDLLAMLAVPLTGVALALLLPVIRVFREWMR